MKLLLTLFAILLSVILTMGAPIDEEARDKRHLIVGPVPAAVPLPFIAPSPFVHGPVVVGPHWGNHLSYPTTVVKYW